MIAFDPADNRQQERVLPTGALYPAVRKAYTESDAVTIIADTTKLTGKARKLYAGAKQDRFGCIEIKMHDQDKAREMVGRMLGAFNDKLDLRTPEERAKSEAKARLPDNNAGCPMSSTCL